MKIKIKKHKLGRRSRTFDISKQSASVDTTKNSYFYRIVIIYMRWLISQSAENPEVKQYTCFLFLFLKTE